MKIFKSERPFELESGGELPSLTVAYHTYGTLSAARDNVVWVCHAMTANSDVADWWPGTVVSGGVLDPKKWFVVCANKLGSSYGSSSPLNCRWDGVVTFRDIVRAHRMLADHLGVDRIFRLIGGSTGGAQAMEWAYMEPQRFDQLVLMATLPRSTAWIQACSEAQRMAIRASGYSSEGLAAARAIAMLQYRGCGAFNLTQNEEDNERVSDFRAASYQRYQGKKLSDRFDVRCYVALLDTMDSHNIGRARGGVEAALGRITTPTLVIGIDTDTMFPAAGAKAMADAMPCAEYHSIHSEFGHDGFLIEITAISELINRFRK